MEQLLSYDKRLFRVINGQWNNDFFDWLMPWLRNSTVWVPLYLFLLLFVAINYKKPALWWILFAIATGALTDVISSKIIKENFFRLRPCNDPSLAEYVRVLVNYRPKSSSFVSSHAANHFGLAMYLFVTLRKTLGNWVAIFFFWAFCIVFAQVYVGVHYPLDVACGALIGILIGYLSGRVFNKLHTLT